MPLRGLGFFGQVKVYGLGVRVRGMPGVGLLQGKYCDYRVLGLQVLGLQD